MAGNVEATLGAGSTFGFDITGGENFSLVEGVQALSLIGDEAESKDATTISNNRKVYGAGLVDSPDMELPMIYLVDDSDQVAFINACKSRTQMNVKATWSNGVSAMFLFQPFGFSIGETTAEGWVMASVKGKQNTSVVWSVNGDIVYPDLVAVTVTGSSSIEFESTSTYTASANPSQALLDGLVWSVSDNTKASITQQGVLTALTGQSGDVYVRATVGAIVGQRLVTIAEEVIIPPDLTGVTVTGSQSLDIDDTTTYTATPLPTGAVFNNLVWSVSDTLKASITQQGVLTALDSGTFNVVVTDGSISNLIAVTIAEVEPVVTDGVTEWATQAEWK